MYHLLASSIFVCIFFLSHHCLSVHNMYLLLWCCSKERIQTSLLCEREHTLPLEARLPFLTDEHIPTHSYPCIHGDSNAKHTPRLAAWHPTSKICRNQLHYWRGTRYPYASVPQRGSNVKTLQGLLPSTLHPNSAIISYTTEGALLIHMHLSPRITL